MKTKLFLFAICMFVIRAGVFGQVNQEPMAGESFTGLGKYQMEESEVPMKVQGIALETYDLKYENSNSVFRVGVLQVEGSTTYIVRAKGMEMEYCCANGIFGAKKMERELRELSPDIIDQNLNRVNYLSQKVICRNNDSKEDHLGLIACYFPKLINEGYLASLKVR